MKNENKSKIILDLAGGTGAWSKLYKDKGYTVYNITLPEYDIRHCSYFKQTLIFRQNGFNDSNLIIINKKDVYGILAAPPCTMFSLARTKAKIPRDFKQGMEIVIACLNIIWECRYESKLKFWCLENPTGFLRQFLGMPVMTFTRCQFGDEGGKPTDLWGYFNKPILLYPDAKPKRGRDNTESKWYNSTKSNPIKRAVTPPGFAKAFFKANK